MLKHFFLIVCVCVFVFVYQDNLCAGGQSKLPGPVPAGVLPLVHLTQPEPRGQHEQVSANSC